MSVYTLVFAGTSPIGNFFAGSVTEKLGANAGSLPAGLLPRLHCPDPHLDMGQSQ
jgi:hypothetical protein